MRFNTHQNFFWNPTCFKPYVAQVMVQTIVLFSIELSCSHDPLTSFAWPTHKFWRPHLDLLVLWFFRILFVNWFLFFQTILVCLDYWRLTKVFFFIFLFLMSSHEFLSFLFLLGQVAVPIAQIPYRKACWVLTSNSQFILNPVEFFYLIICFLVVEFRWKPGNIINWG